jgi:hypothetical protein
MKKILFLSLASILFIGLFSCNKQKYGEVTFWQQTGSGYGVTVVTVNGVSSNITSEYASKPSCGSSGCAVFKNVETGTHSYTASDGSSNWSGTFTISDGVCTTMQLY